MYSGETQHVDFNRIELGSEYSKMIGKGYPEKHCGRRREQKQRQV